MTTVAEIAADDARGGGKTTKRRASTTRVASERVEAREAAYTAEEVSRHARADDCWVVVRGGVYDVTKFVPKHPGGNMIYVKAGGECTALFDSYHPERARAVLEKYRIGALRRARGERADEDIVEYAKDDLKEGEFFADCKAGAAKYFKDNKLDPRVHWEMYAKTLVILAGIVVGHYGSFFAPSVSFAAALALAVLHGTCKAEVGVSIQHDANHGAYGNNRTWLHAMQLTLDVVGASSFMWKQQHVAGHHAYTNVEGIDPDIRCSEKDVRRVNEHQPHEPYHRVQHVYLALMYGLLSLKSCFVDDFNAFFSGRIGWVKVMKFTSRRSRGVLGKQARVGVLLPLLARQVLPSLDRSALGALDRHRVRHRLVVGVHVPSRPRRRRRPLLPTQRKEPAQQGLGRGTTHDLGRFRARQQVLDPLLRRLKLSSRPPPLPGRVSRALPRARADHQDRRGQARITLPNLPHVLVRAARALHPPRSRRAKGVRAFPPNRRVSAPRARRAHSPRSPHRLDRAPARAHRTFNLHAFHRAPFARPPRAFRALASLAFALAVARVVPRRRASHSAARSMPVPPPVVAALASLATALAMRVARARRVDARARDASDARPDASTKPARATRSNKAIVRRLYREVWNNADLASANASAERYVSDDHVLIDPSNPTPEPGVEAYMQHVRGNREALPDYVIAVDNVIEEGDKCVAQLSFRASLNERQARWTGTCVMEFEDGAIVKSWVNTDAMSAMIQLGLMTDLVHTGSLNSRPVTHALMGRDEPHPETVLTGKEWLQYFEEVHESWERRSIDSESARSLRTDKKSGLQVVI